MEFNWPLFWYLLEGFTLLRHFIFLVTRAVVHKMMDTSSTDGTSVDKAFSSDNSITQFPVQTCLYKDAEKSLVPQDASPSGISGLYKDAEKSLVPQDASPSGISEVKQRGFAMPESLKKFGKEVKQHSVAVAESIKSFRKGIPKIKEMTGSTDHGSSLDEFMSGCTINAYNGLPNEGNTCFLNSLLQCLYLTPQFRDKLSKWKNNRGETLLAVENIFNGLDEKGRPYVTTRELTACLGLKPYKQQDVPEVFLLLLNKLDEELTKGSYFKKLYESTMVSLTECTQCKTKDGLDMGCNIVILPLPVSSVRSGEKHWSVNDALEHFLRSSEMKGENQIYCSNCSEKTDATLRQALTSLPRILVVQLKRFEFNFYEQTFVKLENEMHINTTLEVPCEKTSQKDKMSYDLFAICDHYGGFKSGHYTALINPEKKGKWFRFNDSTVTSEEISDPENRNSSLDNSSWNKYDLSRSRTAYVLMYKQRMGREPQKNEDAPVHADLRAPQSRGNLMLEQSPGQDKPEEQLQPVAENRRGPEWQEEAWRREAAPPLVTPQDAMEADPLRTTQKTQNWPTNATILNVFADQMYQNSEHASTSQIPVVGAKHVQNPHTETLHEEHNAGQTFNAQTHQKKAAEHAPNMQIPRNEREAKQKSIMHTPPYGLEAFPSIQLALYDVKSDPESSTAVEAPLINLTDESCDNVQTSVAESVPGVQLLPGDLKSDPESCTAAEAPLINLTGKSCDNVQRSMADSVSGVQLLPGDVKIDWESCTAAEAPLINMTGQSCDNVQRSVAESVPGVQLLPGYVKSDPESSPAAEAPLINLTVESCSNVLTPVPGVQLLPGDVNSDPESSPAAEAPLINLTVESCDNVQRPMADSVSGVQLLPGDVKSDPESCTAAEAPLINLTGQSCDNVQRPVAESVPGVQLLPGYVKFDPESSTAAEAPLITLTGESCDNVQRPVAESVPGVQLLPGYVKSDPESSTAAEAPLINLTGESCSNVLTPVSGVQLLLGDMNSDLESSTAAEAPLITLTGESCSNVQTPMVDSVFCALFSLGDRKNDPESCTATVAPLINQPGESCGNVQTPVAHSFSGVCLPLGDLSSELEPCAPTETLNNQTSKLYGSVQTPVADPGPEQCEV